MVGVVPVGVVLTVTDISSVLWVTAVWGVDTQSIVGLVHISLIGHIAKIIITNI